MAWKYSLLVVANVTATADELIEALRRRAEGASCAFTLLVPAPAGGRPGREAAEQKLAEALDRLRAEGLEVDGVVGDHDPIAAVHDVWDPMRWDEVVISTLPTGASKWLQVDLPHRVEKLTGVQVTHVVAQPPRREVKAEPAPQPERYGVLAPLAAITGKRPERPGRRSQP
jgi:hypothetical protein